MDSQQKQLRDDVLEKAREERLIMGILNVTPDSFSDGGKFDRIETAIQHAEEMSQDGADILDIGGESTRPGADIISAADEQARVLPPIERLYQCQSLPLSIDTYKASTAFAAVKAGAVLINDISGMTFDAKMAECVAETGTGIVVTYNRGEVAPEVDIADDMIAFFKRSFEAMRALNIPEHHVWLDPGVGFSKTLKQNFEVLNRLDVLQEFGAPILVGLSRKSFIGKTLNRETDQRLAGTLASHIYALHKGASVFRAHDVREHRDALTLLNLLESPPHEE